MIKVILKLDNSCEMFSLHIEDENGEKEGIGYGNYWDYNAPGGTDRALLEALQRHGLIELVLDKRWQCEEGDTNGSS